MPLNIVWKGQELLPDTPLDGLPYQAFYERRPGGPAVVATADEHGTSGIETDLQQ